MIWEVAAELNQEGAAKFGDIFNDNLVPIKSSYLARATFEDLGVEPIGFYRVDQEELQELQPAKYEALLNRLSEIFNEPIEELRIYFKINGLPLRSSLVNQIYYRKYFQDYEIQEMLEETLGREDL